jgi:hypothetical protein
MDRNGQVADSDHGVERPGAYRTTWQAGITRKRPFLDDVAGLFALSLISRPVTGNGAKYSYLCVS